MCVCVCVDTHAVACVYPCFHEEESYFCGYMYVVKRVRLYECDCSHVMCAC